MAQVCNPLIADFICNPVSKQRVSMKKEPSLGNAICLIIKLFRHHLVEIFKFLVLKDFCMKPCHTVYRKACCNCKMCHFNLSVINYCHLLNLAVIIRICRLYLYNKPAVNFLNNLVNPWKKP